VFYLCFFLPLLSHTLTLERPPVSVDWSKLPQRGGSSAEKRFAPNRLFGSVEFRGALKGVPQWERVVRLYGSKTGITEALNKAGRRAEAQAWERIKAETRVAPPLRKLQEVNKFVNLWPYRTDMEAYGMVDYWATPEEFVRNSGDCDCFSITKFFALLELGFPADSLRIVALRDKIRNIDHAVLAAYVDDEVYILDNVSPLVLPHSRYGHYQPIFSVNLEYKWTHVMPSG
jgi:predicted transglutaminase-like cysteine proteinase